MAGLEFKVRSDFTEGIAKKLGTVATRAEHVLAVQVQKDTEPFVPASGASAGMYNKSQVFGNLIVYPGPYARYLYNGKVMVFKDPPYLRTINGKEVLSHYGQYKIPISKPLKIKKHHHKDATDHWFEVSKAKNLDKWEEASGKLVKNDLRK